MRRLAPVDPPSDPVAVVASDERPAHDHRPWVMVNMVASVDGATAMDGVSGGLGGPGDRQMFRAIRAVADVVLVAAGTVRAEGYRPPVVDDEIASARATRGQSPRPRLAIVTARVDLDPGLAVFGDPTAPPLVLVPPDAHERSADRVAALERVAEVVAVGEVPGGVDLAAALTWLRSVASVVLAEGGPSLNGQLVALDLVDEMCLTLAPMLVGGRSARVAHGPDGPPVTLELHRILEHDGTLLLGYRRSA